ncbi:MAG: LysM peptidoglycan-binding domain-containing protein [Verrucomicrobiota bacterium]
MKTNLIPSILCAALVLTVGSLSTRGDEVYTVQPGDNLSRIGNHFGVSYHEIMTHNGLASTVIHPGQQLIIPTTPAPVFEAPAHTYEAPGYERYAAPTPPVAPPYQTPVPPQSPSSSDTQYYYNPPAVERPAYSTSQPHAEVLDEQISIPTEQIYHTVRRGESVSSISRLYGIGWLELRRANGILFNRIHPGQRLIIPADVEQPAVCELPAARYTYPQ